MAPPACDWSPPPLMLLLLVVPSVRGRREVEAMAAAGAVTALPTSSSARRLAGLTSLRASSQSRRSTYEAMKKQ